MSAWGLRWNDPFKVINDKLDRIIMSQASIDADNTTVINLLTDLATQTTAILSDLAAFQANPGSVDTSALDATAGKVQAVQSALDSAVSSLTSAAPVTPPPASTGTGTAAS